MTKPEAMLFDLDGTLFRTETLLLPAYHASFDQLRREGLYSGETPPEERILGALGMLLEHIWERVMPETSLEAHQRMDVLLLQNQLEGLLQGSGILYEGVEATLKELHARGIRLFVASNGLEDYVKKVIEARGLGSVFEGLYSAGEFQTKSKVDLVRLLLDKYNIKSAWMVGDRSSDVEAGLKNGLTVVGCDYAGFGKDDELEGSHMRIQSFPELLDYLPKP
ncbi:HAD-IA family hydrolase [Paenibacillus sp. GP183]|uniref:HAD family hydrolase n=1 Tax=Paenibacillus sp. GP183 TaxID=1882751 RepID=UPI0008987AE6|nr:HAD-IA family hydrolase [Paenibacillus sp. GP183]SEB89892.1 haloacid dehalogenase superfamily, subfamily IA, variant 1 with third motif having Dx(3-4)D or Dx(3-4)E [Paenibacillus sp. GP183]